MRKPLETMQQGIPVTTKGHGDMHAITDQVATTATESGVRVHDRDYAKIGREAQFGIRD